MIPRVTHLTVQRSTLGNLQSNLRTMADLQTKMSSGKNVNAPSDDPAAASDMLRLRADQRTSNQYSRNATDAEAWLTTVDTALTSSLSALRRARDLTVQGGDAALGAQSREALAAEIDGVKAQLLSQSNTTYLGRTVFAGTSNAGVAFDSTTYAFTGTVAGVTPPVERKVGDAVDVRVDADGAAVFGEGTTSVFALLDDIATQLRAGGDPTASLDDIDTHMDAMLTQVASVGARHNQVLTAQSTLADRQLALTTQLSSIEDIDLAAVILDLQAQEVAYKGALGATSKVLQPTLLDYLR
ncbi:flagellar hook-associated protein FlgL [Cellulomonas soli]|uniref:Flagellar hook-associated protein FlgL n=1 Tax=Cellulomonas soli TaxID=931535 RepID=A0A512PEQ2_9CELL|nr:flagellar hook-associated protein FlgL [Cellulomonas soli]